jgi:DNA repair exonuclease SbcCD nuclease subunit
MGIKFLHTADWHIGDAFKSIGGEAAVLLSHERFSMVERIARLAGTEQVDVVLVAGDIFDYNVGNETFHKLINAMRHFAGEWVLIPGNHDSACAGSIWKRLDSLTVPANVHCVTEPGILQLKNGEIHILCAPLQHRHESRDTTADWPSLDTPAGSYRIGLAHGGVPEKMPPNVEIENRVAIDRATTARLDYLALGDWHGLLSINERTWYPGTPEPESFSQPKAGNVLMVLIDAPGALPKVEAIRTATHSWSKISFEIVHPGDIPTLDDLLSKLGDPGSQVLRLAVTGAVDVATRAELDKVLEKCSALFRYLESDLSGLTIAATVEDMNRIGATGFLAAAITRLQAMAADPNNSDSHFAPDAIQMLYRYAGENQ